MFSNWLDAFFEEIFGPGSTAGGYAWNASVGRAPYIGPYLGAYAGVKDDMADLRHPGGGDFFGGDDGGWSASSDRRKFVDDFTTPMKAEVGGDSSRNLLLRPDLLASNELDWMVPTYPTRPGPELQFDFSPPPPPRSVERNASGASSPPPVDEVIVRGPPRERVGAAPWTGGRTVPNAPFQWHSPPSRSAQSGHSIAPPPPVSPPDMSWNVPTQFAWRQYEAAVKDALDPETPPWARVVLGGLAVLAAPVAAVEDWITRPLLNTPQTVRNLGVGSGEHLGRSAAWMEQGDKAEAVDEVLLSLIELVQAFLQVGMLFEGFAGGRRSPAPKPSSASPGRRTIYDVIDATGLNKDQLAERELNRVINEAGGETLPTHYGRGDIFGIDVGGYFKKTNTYVVGETKVRSGYRVGNLKAALEALSGKAGGKLGPQGSFEYSLRQAIKMVTGKSTQRNPISPQVRETGRRLLANLPGHKRLFLMMNEFGEYDLWDLDFWEMYDW